MTLSVLSSIGGIVSVLPVPDSTSLLGGGWEGKGSNLRRGGSGRGG